jgi:hypothetical protein
MEKVTVGTGSDEQTHANECDQAKENRNCDQTWQHEKQANEAN